MARKNAKLSESSVHSIGLVFDQRTRSVMAQDNNPDTIKEKVAAVREVVPDRSKHEITLVLMHFDHNVEQAIQAFLDNGAEGVLQEWHSTASANKPTNKKKKKKKIQDKEQPPGDSTNSATGPSTSGQHQVLPQRQNRNRRQEGTTAAPLSENLTMESTEKKQLDGSTAAPAPVRSSGIKVNSDPVESTTSISQSDPTHEAPETTFKVDKSPRSNKSDTSKLDHPDVAKSKTDSSELVNSQNSFPDSVYVGKRPVVYNNSRQGHMTKQHIKVSSQRVKSTNKTNDDVVSTPVTATVVTKETSKQRPHNLLVTSTNRERTMSETSTTSASSRKPHAGLEKSLKDLQRQTVSLQRQKMIMNEEMDRSMKQLSHNFDLVRDALNEREASLMFKLTKVKTEAQNLLAKRQQQASDLRRKLDQAPSMNEFDLINLRADIKHFVSERKMDEELGSTKRFTCDQEGFIEQVNSYGEVHPVMALYSTRRPSVTSITSSLLSPDDMLSPLSPRITTSTAPPPGPSQHKPATSKPSQDVSPVKPTPAPIPASLAGAKVISQSESLTRYELSKPHNEKPVGPRSGPGQRRGQGPRSPSREQRGRNPRSDDQGQKQVNRGQGQTSRGVGQSNKNQGQMDTVQGQSSRGQVYRGQQQNNRGQGQMDRGLGEMNKTTSHDNAEFGDIKKSRSARRRQKQREKQREQKIHEQQKPDDGESLPALGNTTTTDGDGKHTAVKQQTAVTSAGRNTRAPGFRKRDDSQKGDNTIQFKRSQSPRKRNQGGQAVEQDQGRLGSQADHEGQNQGQYQRRPRNRRQRTRSRGDGINEGQGRKDEGKATAEDKKVADVVTDDRNITEVIDSNKVGVPDTKVGVPDTKVGVPDTKISVPDTNVTDVIVENNVNGLDTNVTATDITATDITATDVTVDDQMEPPVTATDHMINAESEITELPDVVEDESVDVTSDLSVNHVTEDSPQDVDVNVDVNVEDTLTEKSHPEPEVTEDSIPDEVLSVNDVNLSETVINNVTTSTTTETLSMQKSVTVSVKATTEQHHSVILDNHKDCAMNNVQNANDDSNVDDLKDINANNHTKIGTMNGSVTQSTIKKATVSIEKFNEVTTKATISVENLNSAEDALPQRKVRNRRRDKDNDIEDDGVDDRPANGVCQSDNSYEVMNGSSNGHD